MTIVKIPNSAGCMQSAAKSLVHAFVDNGNSFEGLAEDWLNSLEELSTRYFVQKHGEWDVNTHSFKPIDAAVCIELSGITTTGDPRKDVIIFLEYIARGGFHPRPEKPVIPYGCDGGSSLEAAPERPELDEGMKYEAALKTVREIPNFDGSEDDEERLVGAIVRESGTNDSGYEIAKELEFYSGNLLEFNTMTIEALDLYSGFADDELKEAGKEWVKQYGIKPQFEIGARVKWRNHEGVIVGSDDHYPARYKVRTDDQKGSEAYLVEFEDATLVEVSEC